MIDAPSDGAAGVDPAAPPSPKRAAGQLWPAFAVPVLLLLPTLLFAWGRDPATFAYVGQVIVDGGMPYRDAWDIKPPGIYLLYAALRLLSPDGGWGYMATVRSFDVLLAGVTGLLLAQLVRHWGRPEWGTAAAAWYAALYLSGTYWSLGQAEAWANPLVLGAALLLLQAGASDRIDTARLCGAGLLLGAAALLKFTAVLPALPFLIPALYRKRLFRAAALVLGGLLPLLAAFLWLRAGNAWDAYLEIQRDFVVPYTRLTAPGAAEGLLGIAAQTGRWLLKVWPAALLGLAGAWLWRSAGRGLVVGAFTAGLLTVWVQHKYFAYHWQPALPWLALLAAAGGASVLRQRPRWSALAPTLAAAAWLLAMYGGTYLDAARYAAGLLPRDQWYARFGRPHGGDYSFLAGVWAAEYVREHTKPGETVLVWGFEPNVYLFSDRRASSRYFFNVPLTAPFAPPGWQTEYFDGIVAKEPQLLLVLRNDEIPWASGTRADSEEMLNFPQYRMPPIRDLFEDRYVQVEDFTIHPRWVPPPF
ncbi:MAG: hypothetical protein ACK47B_01645 [Armatimonadota bacterium]